MPSKIQLDENLWFLFICLQKSDYKTIDFNAVGRATNLKPPAARMRYTRLRRQIEGGALNGTNGTPFSKGPEKFALHKKNRRSSSQQKGDNGLRLVSTSRTSTPDLKIKSGQEEFSEWCGNDSTESNDSEDEMPLAKRRYGGVKPTEGFLKEHSAAPSGFQGGNNNHYLVPSPPDAHNGQQDTTQGHLRSHG